MRKILLTTLALTAGSGLIVGCDKHENNANVQSTPTFSQPDTQATKQEDIASATKPDSSDSSTSKTDGTNTGGKDSIQLPVGSTKIACNVDELSDIIATPTTLLDRNPAPAIVPGLAKWQGGVDNLVLTAKSRIVLEPASAASLASVSKRLQNDLAEITGIQLPVVTNATLNDGDIGMSLTPCNDTVKTRIGDEGYTMSIGKTAMLRGNLAKDAGNNTNSIFYATRSLLQMLSLDGKGAGKHNTLKQGYAIDYPLYAERTFMVDTGRGFTDKESLKAYMKLLGWYKINTLHLHLTDDLLNRTPGNSGLAKEGFRLYSNNPAFQNKQPLSADGLYYSKDDWNELEDAAAENGIALVPEIDSPGHATALVKALKRLYPNNPSSGNELAVTHPDTLAYIKDVWNEFLPWFRSKRVHVGADESSSSSQIAFINDMATFFKSKGKTLQIWNDAVTSVSLLDPDVVVQYWSEGSTVQSNKNKWINSSIAFYVNPQNGGAYAESLGFAGDSFYADDSGLGIDHQNAYGGPNWDWFGNTKALTSSVKDLPPLGGQLSLWNDLLYHNPYTFEDAAHYLMSDAFPAAGQIWWNGQKRDASGTLVPYSELRKSVAKLQYGPGTSSVPMFVKYPLSATIPTFNNLPKYKITPAYPAQNGVLEGSAEKYDCKSCGGGEVGYLGTYPSQGKAGAVTLTVPVTKSGKYLLPIYYVMGGTSAQPGQLNINGSQTPVKISFLPTGGGASGSVPKANQPFQLSEIDQEVIQGVFVNLQAGDNTIKFNNPTGGMPNIGGVGTPLLQPED